MLLTVFLFLGSIYFAIPICDRLFGGSGQPNASRWSGATIALVVLIVIVILLFVFGPPAGWHGLTGASLR